MNIIFVCRKFGNVAGGMERMCVAIMNSMIEKGHKVGLITWDSADAIPHYIMSSEIVWHKLDCGDPEIKASWKLRCQRFNKARKFIKSFRADVIIGFQSGGFVFGYTSSIFLGIPCVAAERVSPDTWQHVRKRFADRIIDIYALFFAKNITVQFQSYIQYYPVFLKNKIKTIPNPIYSQKSIKSHVNENILLNVGRLCPQKNQTFLIQSFSLIHEKYPGWKLVIVGDGIDEIKLKDLTKKLDLQDSVVFTGAIKNVTEWYDRADIFVFPSIFEGFPNALSEALAHGLPAVGFENTFGVNELIIENANGLLTTNNIDSFSNIVKYLIKNENVRKRMSKEAVTSVVKYRPESVFEQWNDLFLELANQKNK